MWVVCVCVCVCVHACVLLLLLLSHSVVSDSLQPHGLYCTKLLYPWDFPGKNTGLGCQFCLQGIFPTQELNLYLLYLLYWQVLYHWDTWEDYESYAYPVLLYDFWYILFIQVLSFTLRVAKSVSTFFFLTKPTFGFVDVSSVFFVFFISFISSLIFVISFLH